MMFLICHDNKNVTLDTSYDRAMTELKVTGVIHLYIMIYHINCPYIKCLALLWSTTSYVCTKMMYNMLCNNLFNDMRALYSKYNICIYIYSMTLSQIFMFCNTCFLSDNHENLHHRSAHIHFSEHMLFFSP